MLKIAICDDADREASQLETLLLSYPKMPVETYVYTSPQKLLDQLSPAIHCVFLDIDMPQMTGIEMAREIRKVNPLIPIIFVTSYREYMEQVFEVQTFDYLLKPVTDANKLYQTLDRIVRFLDLGQSFFNFSFGQQHHSLPLTDLVFFEKEGRAVFIHTQSETFRTLMKTQEILEKLPSYFIQIHASYVINPKYVQGFSSQSVTLLRNGDQTVDLPISRKFQGSFKEAYHRYLSERMF